MTAQTNTGSCWPGLGVPGDWSALVLEGDDAQAVTAAARLTGHPDATVVSLTDVCPPAH